MKVTVEPDTLGAIAVFVGVLLGGGYMAAQVIMNAATQSACLEHGWPNAKVDYAFNRYCVKRVDQTDVVVPLREVDK